MEDTPRTFDHIYGLNLNKKIYLCIECYLKRQDISLVKQFSANFKQETHLSDGMYFPRGISLLHGWSLNPPQTLPFVPWYMIMTWECMKEKNWLVKKNHKRVLRSETSDLVPGNFQKLKGCMNKVLHDWVNVKLSLYFTRKETSSNRYLFFITEI